MLLKNIQQLSQIDDKKILSNNKTGIIVEMETLIKVDKESLEYLKWISKAQLDHPNLYFILEIYQDQIHIKSFMNFLMENHCQNYLNQFDYEIDNLYYILLTFSKSDSWKNLTLFDFVQFKRKQNEILIKLIVTKKVKIKESESINILNFTSPE